MVLQEYEPWAAVDKAGKEIYTEEEQKPTKATDRVARSIYIQGNGGMTDVYTSYDTAYEICDALQGRYENTEPWGLTELTEKINESV